MTPRSFLSAGLALLLFSAAAAFAQTPKPPAVPDLAAVHEEVGQLDCFAEAANTGTTLKMIADAGLLRFHTPLTGEPTMRGVPYGTFGLVHAGATIRENANGRLWVVDTWYLGNGAPSFVVDRDAWRGGWSPPSGAGS